MKGRRLVKSKEYVYLYICGQTDCVAGMMVTYNRRNEGSKENL